MALPLFPYQIEGAAWLAKRERAGLHDEMGVGKTATLVRAINDIGARRGLVVGPAGLRDNFIGEWRKFSDYPLRLCKGQNIHDFVSWSRDRYDILVTSYELITKWWPRLKEAGEFIDFIALDEAHYLKNMETKRAIAICGKDAGMFDCITEWCQYAWWATGTPIPNDPIDIYTFLRFTDAIQLSLTEFVRQFFYVRQTEFGTKQTIQPGMAATLSALIDNNRIRRTKKDIGMQLPPIFLTSTLVDGDTDRIRDLLRNYPGLERSIMLAVEQGGLSNIWAEHIATLRRLIGEAKAVPYGHELVEELRFTNDKRVVFGIHRDALYRVQSILNKAGLDCVMITGETPMNMRGDIVKRFQEDSRCRVFLGNIKAAGTGLTLHAACAIDMLESDWTPAGNAQAIMRVHRIGQERAVHARFITLANSFDEQVNRVVSEKTAAIAEIEGTAMHAAPTGDFAY